MKKLTIILALSTIAVSGCKEIDSDISRADRPGPTGEMTADAAPLNESQKAYQAANDKMHKGMGVIDADPDIAFMQGMVPHHEGAVDMAEIVLKHGKDPEARALAQAVIDSQTKEIAQMNAWLKKRAVKPAAASDIDHSAMGH